MVALCRVAGAAAQVLQHSIHVLHEVSPDASSQSNGGADSSVERLEAKARATSQDTCSERRSSVFLGCLLPSLVKHAGDCITRHRYGVDG